jgi:multiple sugar transport system permease protein
MPVEFVMTFWRELSPARKKLIIGLLFLAPGFLFTIWLRYYPIFFGTYMSFFEWDVVNPPGEFIGFENYLTIFRQGFYWQAWGNMIVYTLLVFGLTFWVPVMQALVIDMIGRRWIKNTLTTLYLLPAVIPVTATALIWRWIYHPSYGVANSITSALGLGTFTWLQDPEIVKAAIILPGMIGGGLVMLLYLAALYSIPDDIYDAAMMDGASSFQIIRYVKLPFMRQVIFIQALFTLVASFQLLDMPFVMTGGGPARSSETMGIYIYNTYQQELSLGRASAASLTLFIVLAVVTYILLIVNRSEAE